MVSFNVQIQKFDKQGEKTGWTYIEISAAQAKKLNPGVKVSFRVKGTLDNYTIKQTALLPMGDGKFILPLKSDVRKALGKKQGDKLKVAIDLDESNFILSPDLMACLQDEPLALMAFKKLPGSHQKYYSNWVESAKTPITKTKRIVMAVTSLARKQSFAEMLRENKSKKI
ncbi:MAG: YdeI/OmpD-associated family protein [Flammeovirgaceae bacterium]|nr:YdeI/OmpD-associated family protein [Flammeovirgaceae bacterium]